MTTALACPPATDYQALLRGECAEAASETLLHHLSACPTCASAVAALGSDSLVADVHQLAHTPLPSDTNLTALVERLGHLAPTMSAGYAPAAFDPVLEPAQEPDEIGRLGEYRLLDVLGRGGMGVVYRAEDMALRRPVALKVIRPELAANVRSRARFFREARSAAALEHENVVPVYQVGEAAGTVFLAMPLLAGETLEARLRRGRLSVAEAVHVARSAAAGLVAAHAAGLIHRDLKPANLFLLRDTNRVVLLDFGLARPSGDDGLSEPGLLVGTPGYLAPEQACGRNVDQRADLFSLGCTLYHALTGTPPFDGPDVLSKLHALANRTPPLADRVNRAVPHELALLTARLLERDPSRRPASAQAVLNELAALKLRPCRRKQLQVLAISMTLAMATVWATAAAVRVYDKKGNEIARVAVPEGGKVVVEGTADEAALPSSSPLGLPGGVPSAVEAPLTPTVAIPAGMRAFTLRLPELQTQLVGLLPGGYVDVMTIKRSTDGSPSKPEFVARNRLVLAVSLPTTPAPLLGGRWGPPPESTPLTLTLALTTDEVLRLTEAEVAGSLLVQVRREAGKMAVQLLCDNCRAKAGSTATIVACNYTQTTFEYRLLQRGVRVLNISPVQNRHDGHGLEYLQRGVRVLKISPKMVCVEADEESALKLLAAQLQGLEIYPEVPKSNLISFNWSKDATDGLIVPGARVGIVLTRNENNQPVSEMFLDNVEVLEVFDQGVGLALTAEAAIRVKNTENAPRNRLRLVVR